jgi:hypothetical protein
LTLGSVFGPEIQYSALKQIIFDPHTVDADAVDFDKFVLQDVALLIYDGVMFVFSCEKKFQDTGR